MKSITQKLDLNNFIEQFKNFYARDKNIDMMGDINQHYRYIMALSKVEFPDIKDMPNLDEQLMRLKKQAILKIEDIYSFIKIVDYFNALKATSLPNPLDGWIAKIDIPQDIVDISLYFTNEGNINPEKEPELYEIEKALKHNKSELKDRLYRLAHSSSLKDYLVDTQIHFLNGEETLMVRGGFNRAIKASVIGRSSGGFSIFYHNLYHISKIRKHCL